VISVGNGGEDFQIDGPITYFGYNMYSTVTGFTPASYQENNQSPPASLEDLFVSIVASSEDLHLEGGATAIDTGTPLSFTEDIDEDPRPMAFAWDIGADEAEDEGLAISSAADQTFTVGDPDTLISAITITNSSPAGVITAASDLRIRIPPSFNMTWDTTDTTAVLGGVAAAKVSTAVTYEDSDKTLVLDVTTTFAADDSVTIQGLNFINFTGLSGLANLTVDIYNDGASDATDGKTIEIVSAGPLSISSAANQIFQMGDPATAIATITITEDASIPVITAADDLRVQIPIGFNMTWDTSDTGAVLGGTGVSKVSPVVSYEDSGRTLRLDVTSDFAAGETVTVSALSFDGFTVASAPDNLELEVDGAGAPGRITLEETVTGGTSDTSPVMMPTIQGGTSQTYVLSIATRRNRDVTAVSGGGGLTWTERTEQCSGRNHQGMRVWTAQGSPGSPFQVQIDYNDSMPLSAVLGRYSGVASFEDPTSENTNGESGSCSGGSDNSSPQLTLTSTVANSIHVVALNHRNRGVRSFSAGYSAVGTHREGRSGRRTRLAVYQKTFNPAAADTFQATLRRNTDWATGGIVLNPATGGGGTADAIDNRTIEVQAGAIYISSAAKQTFAVGDPATAISPITIQEDGASPAITVTKDLRIRIPGSLPMAWDSTDTTAVISGTAAAKVSTTVSYQDGDRTLVVDVTSDFAAGETIVITGLSFTGFTDPSPYDNLELVVTNNDAVAATDDKTIRVDGNANYRSIGINAAVLHETGTASISSGASVVTFGGGASLPANVARAADRVSPSSIRPPERNASCWSGSAW
jgi:hypothetical protein